MAKSRTKAGLGGSKQHELAEQQRQQKREEIQAELDKRNRVLETEFSAENKSDRDTSKVAQLINNKPSKNTPSVGRTQRFGYVPSSKIRTWAFKDRTLEELDDDKDWTDLVEDVEANGVLTAVVLRALEAPDINGNEFEEIAGYKRVSAAKLFDYDVPAEIVEMTDEEALIRQASENSGRSNPAFWSRAMLLFRVLDNSKFEHLSQHEKGDRVGFKTASQTSTAKRALRLISEELRSQITMHQLSYLAILEIVQFLDEHDDDLKEREQALVNRAEEINAKPKSCQALVSKMRKEFLTVKKPATPVSKKVFVSKNGKPVVTFKTKNKGYSVELADSVKNKVNMEELQNLLIDFFNSKGVGLEEREDD